MKQQHLFTAAAILLLVAPALAGSIDTGNIVTTPDVSQPVVVSAHVAWNTGALLSEKGSFIDSCTRNSTGDWDCDFQTSFFSSAPNCTVTAQTGGTKWCTISNVATSSIDINCHDTSGLADVSFFLVCHGD